MKNLPENGACVSCGRRSGPYARVCPYCGEQVWQPLWRRTGQWCVLLLPPLLLACLAGLAHPDWTALAGLAWGEHPACGFLFAAGTGLLLLPVADGDLVASSRSELRRWQAGAVLGGWVMGACAATGAAALSYGTATGAATWLLAAGAGLCVTAMPFFFRIPWRSLAAAALLAAAFIASVQ